MHPEMVKWFTWLPAPAAVADQVLSHDQMHPGTPEAPGKALQYGKVLQET